MPFFRGDKRYWARVDMCHGGLVRSGVPDVLQLTLAAAEYCIPAQHACEHLFMSLQPNPTIQPPHLCEGLHPTTTTGCPCLCGKPECNNRMTTAVWKIRPNVTTQ